MDTPITLYVVVIQQNVPGRMARVEGPYTLALAQERHQHISMLPNQNPSATYVWIAELQHFQDDKVPFTFVKD